MNYQENVDFAPKLFTWEYLKEIGSPRQILLTVGTHVNPHSPALYVGQEGIATYEGIIKYPLAVIALPLVADTPYGVRIYYNRGIYDAYLAHYAHFISDNKCVINDLQEKILKYGGDI